MTIFKANLFLGFSGNADFTKDKTSIHDMVFTDATKLKLRHKHDIIDGSSERLIRTQLQCPS